MAHDPPIDCAVLLTQYDVHKFESGDGGPDPLALSTICEQAKLNRSIAIADGTPHFCLPTTHLPSVMYLTDRETLPVQDFNIVSELGL